MLAEQTHLGRIDKRETKTEKKMDDAEWWQSIPIRWTEHTLFISPADKGNKKKQKFVNVQQES